jgi:hypothetical protein
VPIEAPQRSQDSNANEPIIPALPKFPTSGNATDARQ